VTAEDFLERVVRFAQLRLVVDAAHLSQQAAELGVHRCERDPIENTFNRR
jgi:hypothetical protein